MSTPADEPAATIARLRALHADGLLDDEELAQKLERLRERHGAAAVNSLLGADDAPEAAPSGVQLDFTGAQAGDITLGDVVGRDKTTIGRQHNQSIAGDNSGVAIAGDNHGPLFVDGRRASDQQGLLRDYLARVADKCDELPLQPFQDRRDLRDEFAVSLAQVYTELATTGTPVLRERFAGAALAELDAEKLLNEQVGDGVLPRRRRLAAGPRQPWSTGRPPRWCTSSIAGTAPRAGCRRTSANGGACRAATAAATAR